MKKLRLFQQTGSLFLQTHYHALLGDEMGLGKTTQALHALDGVGAKTALVVCPASVRSGWAKEAREWGTKCALEVISYNGAVNGEVDTGTLYDAIILDEVHFLKTVDSQRTQAIFGNNSGLARFAKYKWGLSGTPILNRPREFYPILKTLHGKALHPYNTWASFTQRYCGAFFDGFSINTKGASHIDELRGKLDGFMLRRTKKEVLPELPARIISYPEIELSQAELRPILDVEREIGNREAYLSATHESFAQLGDLATLRRITGSAMAPKIAAFCADMVDVTGKLVVFAWHREVIKELAERLKVYRPAVFVGGMNDREKDAVKDRFINGDSRIFIGQITAAGTGLDGLQTVCSNVVFAELSWVPGEMAQAIDRLHRMGQDETVNAYLLHTPGTLTSAMLSSQHAKQSIISRLMGE